MKSAVRRVKVPQVTVTSWNSPNTNSPVYVVNAIDTLYETINAPTKNNGNYKTATPWSFTHLVVVYPNQYRNVTSLVPGGTNVQSTGPQLLPLSYSSNLPSRRTIVYNDMVSKLGGALRGSVDLSIDAFQARQTGKMVKSAVTLLNMVRKFQVSRVLKERLSPSQASAIWLEYQYGWKPLVNTIWDVSSMVMKKATSSSSNSMQRIKVRSAEVQNGAFTTTSGTGGWQKYFYNFSLSERGEMAVTFVLKNSLIEQLSRFTSLNPASIAWETLPYSFVVDWVYNVSGYLRSAETAMAFGSSFHSGYYSQGSKTQVLSSGGGNYSTNSNITTEGGTQQEYLTQFNRYVLSSYPFPRPPQFSAKLGIERLASAASLAMEHFKRSR